MRVQELRKQFAREGQEHLFAGLYEGGEQEREALLEVGCFKRASEEASH